MKYFIFYNQTSASNKLYIFSYVLISLILIKRFKIKQTLVSLNQNKVIQVELYYSTIH